MKLSHLFEENHKDTPLDWIVRSILYRYAIYSSENQHTLDNRLNKFKKSGLTPYEFYKQSENGTFDGDEVNLIMDAKVEGNQVSATNFSIRSLDEIGDPPFSFDVIDRAFTIIDSKNLSKPEPWFPKSAGFIRISSCPNFTLTGIDKYVKSCGEFGIVGENTKGGVLGLLKIKGLNFVRLDLPDQAAERGENLSEIIMKYLPASKTYEGGDILDCQSELIDAGFEEFAKL